MGRKEADNFLASITEAKSKREAVRTAIKFHFLDGADTAQDLSLLVEASEEMVRWHIKRMNAASESQIILKRRPKSRNQIH